MKAIPSSGLGQTSCDLVTEYGTNEDSDSLGHVQHALRKISWLHLCLDAAHMTNGSGLSWTCCI